MATSSGTIKATEFGNQENTGVVAIQADGVNRPGGLIFTVWDGASIRAHFFMWFDTIGRLKFLAADGIGPLRFTDEDQTLTYTNFDQDAVGSIVTAT